jgi:hypothetical protein
LPKQQTRQPRVRSRLRLNHRATPRLHKSKVVLHIDVNGVNQDLVGLPYPSVCFLFSLLYDKHETEALLLVCVFHICACIS